MDTLGGDAPPAVLVAGALDAVADLPFAALAFYGDAAVVAPQLVGTSHEAIHAPRRLTVDDSLRATLRGTLDSSMRAAVAALAAGEADAVVSAGSTGALMALSRHLVGMLPGARRPAIVKALAGEGGRIFRLLDLGANLGADAAGLHQFARMGVAAAMDGGVSTPTVGLLNVGSELRKGPAAVRAAAGLLQADSRLRYAGFVEPDRMFAAGPDVIVAEGFAGNIALKAAEGAARMARYLLAQEVGPEPSAGAAQGRAAREEAPLAREPSAGVREGEPLAREPSAGAARERAGREGEPLARETAAEPLRRRLQRARAAYNPQNYNGAILLGLTGVVVKSHGGADRNGFAHAVRQAADALSGTLVRRVAAHL